jgi:hypothetical protein
VCQLILHGHAIKVGKRLVVFVIPVAFVIAPFWRLSRIKGVDL